MGRLSTAQKLARLIAQGDKTLGDYLSELVTQCMHHNKDVANEAWELFVELVLLVRSTGRGNTETVIKVSPKALNRMASRGGKERDAYLTACVHQSLHERNDVSDNALICLKMYFSAASRLLRKYEK